MKQWVYFSRNANKTRAAGRTKNNYKTETRELECIRITVFSPKQQGTDHYVTTKQSELCKPSRSIQLIKLQNTAYMNTVK